MNFHYHILINPNAGSGNGKKTAGKIVPLLDQKNISYTLHYSEYRGHDCDIAEQLAKETLVEWSEETQETQNPFPILLVVGGDGTLHQVLATFYQLDVEFPVGYIPAGSGNDFARGIGLPLDAEKALENILSVTSPKRINLLNYHEKISDHQGIAINNFGIGLDAAVVHATNHSNNKKYLNKYNLGSFSYILSILRVLIFQKGFPILVDVGGKMIPYKKALLCTATNHPYFGGGIPIVPTADMSKPTIDLVIVERINPLKLGWLIWLLLQKKQLRSKNFHHYTTSKLRVISTTPQYGQEDGEDLAKQPFDLQITPTSQLFWGETTFATEETLTKK
ncbi:diacylglycerol kinase family lipid kinase [Enterococcus hirae]|nr:diacylglycerol kinase family lipid kinase [Enterococcus hirae]